MANHLVFAESDVPHEMMRVFGQFTSTPKTPTRIENKDALCLTLDKSDLKLCSLYKIGDIQFELRLFRGQDIFGRILAVNSACSLPNMFDVGFIDINQDNQKDVVIVTNISCGNGLPNTEAGLAVFTKQKQRYKLSDYLMVSNLASSYGGFYRKDENIYLVEADWIGSEKIHPDRQCCGTYLATNWYRWDKDKFMHDTSLPIVTRRLTEGFNKDQINYFKQYPLIKQKDGSELGYDSPYPWFNSPKTKEFTFKEFPNLTMDTTNRLLREPTKDKPVSSCKIVSYEQVKNNFAFFTPCHN